MTAINLIPHEVRQAEAIRTRLVRWAVAVAIAALVGLVPYMMEISQKAKAATLQAEVDRLDEEATAIRTKLRAATASAQKTQSELERSKALRGKRSWSGMLALIASSMPQDSWLQSISTDPETPPAGLARVSGPVAVSATTPTVPAVPESVTIEAPRRLRLVGFSTSDAEPLNFVENLTESGVFSRVALQKATRAPNSELGDLASYQFEIVCEW